MQQKPKRQHFECDMVVSLQEGVALLRSDTKEWIFKRRLRNGHLVDAPMPKRIEKQIATVA